MCVIIADNFAICGKLLKYLSLRAVLVIKYTFIKLTSAMEEGLLQIYYHIIILFPSLLVS